MIKIFLITLSTALSVLLAESNHIIFSKIVIAPDNAEKIAIYNPTDDPINLSNYYLSDAEYSIQGKNYYNLPEGENYWSGFSSDFFVRFPNLEINPGETLEIGLHDQISFNNYYSYSPDLTLQSDMLSVPDGEDTIGSGSDLLGDSYEVLILFYWDNSSALIQDVDYFYWGDNLGLSYYGIDKTGYSTYYDDTPFEIQAQNILEAHNEGEVFIRKSTNENGESNPIDIEGFIGNGITGHDETSEVFIDSWEIRAQEISGCTDDSACNYNENAESDNDSCTYSEGGFDCNGDCLNDQNSDGICESCPIPEDPAYSENALQECSDVNNNGYGDCCTADAITHTIEGIVTGSSVGFTATIRGLIVGFGDYRQPNNGPQVIELMDLESGHVIDLVIWDWDVITPTQSNISYMVDPSNLTEYVILAEGAVDLYNGSFQFEIAEENNIIEYYSYNPQGEFTGDENIDKATIVPAPFVIIPTLGERLDYSFSVPGNSKVVIRIFDFNGNFVTSLLDDFFVSSGIVERFEDQSDWDGTDHHGQIVAPGTYLMHIEATNWISGEYSYDMAPIVVGVYK